METANFEREPQAQQEVKKPVEESAEPGKDRLELASAIGNQGVQRVATSPELQRSPAAAGLLPQGQIAREAATEEKEGGDEPLEQEADAPGGKAAPGEAEQAGPPAPAAEGAENAPAAGGEPQQAAQEAPPAGQEAEAAAPAGPEEEKE